MINDLTNKFINVYLNYAKNHIYQFREKLEDEIKTTYQNQKFINRLNELINKIFTKSTNSEKTKIQNNKINITNNLWLFLKQYDAIYKTIDKANKFDKISIRDVNEAKTNRYKYLTDSQRQYLVYEEIFDLFNNYVINNNQNNIITLSSLQSSQILLNFETNKLEYDCINKIISGNINISELIDNYIKCKKLEYSDLEFKIVKDKFNESPINFIICDEDDNLEEINENFENNISKSFKQIKNSSNKYLCSYLLGIIMAGYYDGICADNWGRTTICALISSIIETLHLNNYIEYCNCANGCCCHFVETSKIINYIFHDKVIDKNIGYYYH